jgi:isocitrate/isopropylmalate dehydrogenase
MNNSIKAEDRTKEISEIRENYEDEYWSKKYGVSSDEIKKNSHHKDISTRIVEAAFKKEKLQPA